MMVRDDDAQSVGTVPPTADPGADVRDHICVESYCNAARLKNADEIGRRMLAVLTHLTEFVLQAPGLAAI
jgi:hypothetical protein